MPQRVEMERRARLSGPLEYRRSKNWPKPAFGGVLSVEPAGTEVAMHLHKFGPEGDAMTICGVITTRDVLKHGATIVREFGTLAYLRCCVAILARRRTTFLNCVCELRQ
ncbi:MAG: hypothetical protein LC689_16280 [Myxococcales bacterium]|nr:hypothetical protein [Myxococcales bacterium]